MDPTYVHFRQSLEPDDFAPFLQAFLTANRLALAMTVWMFYDLLLSSSELYMSFVSPWSLGHTLFLLNRLVSPLMMLIHTLSLTIPHPAPWANLEPQLCSVAPWTVILGNWLVVFCTGSALIARIHVLWQKRWVLIGVTAAFAIILCGNLIYFAFITSKSGGVPSLFPVPFTGCVCVTMSRFFWIGIATTGLWETICVILTLWKSGKAESKHETPILYVLFYDGILYYVSAIAIKVLAITTSYHLETFAFGQSNAILALTSMLCTRLYLRLRSIARLNSPIYNSGIPLDVPNSRPFEPQHYGDEVRRFRGFEKPLPPTPTP